jgi:hypothetical protein
VCVLLGVDDAEAAYELGQVVKCRILECNMPSKGSPKLKLSLDIPGSLSNDNDDVVEGAASSSSSSQELPSSGSVVSGTIIQRDSKAKNHKTQVVHVRLDAPFSGVVAVLPCHHLSDFGSMCRVLYRSDKFAAGKKLTNLLVLNVNGTSVQITMKPTLLAAASSTTKLMLPSSFEEAEKSFGSKKKSANDSRLVAGVVKAVESYGVFVECAAGFTALVPRGQLPYRLISLKDSEPLPSLNIGDTLIASCYSVDSEKKRVVLSCASTHVACSRSVIALAGNNKNDTNYLQQMFADRHSAAQCEYERQSEGGAAAVKPLPDMKKYPLGTTVDATVLELLADGSLKLSGDDKTTIMVAPAYAGGCSLSSELGCHAEGAASLSMGDVVKVRILDVNYGDLKLAPASTVAARAMASTNKSNNAVPEPHLVVSCSLSLVKSGRTKRRKTASVLLEDAAVGDSESSSKKSNKKKKTSSDEPQEKSASDLEVVKVNNDLINVNSKVNGKVLLVNAEWGYAVVALSLTNALEEDENNGSVLGYLMLSDFSCPMLGFSDLVEANKCTSLKEVSAEGLVVGQVVECTVIAKPASSANWLNGFDKSSNNYYPHKENVFLARAADFEEASSQASGKKSSSQSAQANKAATENGSNVVKKSNVVVEDATWADLVVGTRYRATCKSVREDGCSVVLNSSAPGTNQEVSGFVNVLELASSAKEAQGWSNFKSKSYGKKISEGTELVVELISVNREEKSVDLTAHVGQSSNFGELNSVMLGQVLDSDVVVNSQPAVMLALGGGKKGRVCITELCEPDAWTSMEVNENGFVTGSVQKDDDEVEEEGKESSSKKISFNSGDFYDVVLLSSYNKMGKNKKKGLGKNVVDCSIRTSRLKEAKSSNKEASEDSNAVPSKAVMPPVGAVVNGFVSSTTSSGCFVRLQHDVDARVLIKDLADSFVQDPVAEFPPGRLVAGCVLTVDANGVSLTLRPSKVLGDARKQAIASVNVRGMCICSFANFTLLL